MMLKLLETLTDVFDECPACARDFQELKTTEANGNRDYKERMVKTWYAQIKPHITEVTRRNNDVILRDLVPFLQRLNLRAKWLDSDLDDGDRGHLWSYINQLTYLSCLHCEVDPKQVQALHTMSCRVQDIFKVSDEHIMSFDIRSLGELAQEVKRMGPQLAPMMKQLVTPGGTSGLQSMISAQVNNFASQAMKQLQQPGPAPSAAAEAGIPPTYSTSQLQRRTPEEVD